MKRFFSPSTAGFYTDVVHGSSMPSDALDEREWGISYDELMEGQENGHVISSHDGKPILVITPPPSSLEMATAKQSELMAVANQQIAILKPAVDGGYAKPGHNQLLADWQRCRYELTLVPEQPGWPDKPQWPTEPEKVI